MWGTNNRVIKPGCQWSASAQHEIQQLLKITEFTKMRAVASAVLEAIGYEYASGRWSKRSTHIQRWLDSNIQLAFCHIQMNRSSSPRGKAKGIPRSSRFWNRWIQRESNRHVLNPRDEKVSFRD